MKYQVSSNCGFAGYNLSKGDICQIDNGKSSCALFLLEGEISFDLGVSQKNQIIKNR